MAEPLDPALTAEVADPPPVFPPLLSIGVLSVGEHNYQRRWEQRKTWIGVAQKQSNPLSLVYARFVVRCGARMYSSTPYSPSEALLGENATHGDIVCTDIAEDAGKLKGPSLLVLAWYDHALRVQPRSRFIATADDDAYVHLAPGGILDILRALPSSASSGRSYIGAMHGWTFNATEYRFKRFGWSGTGDEREGPFPFATGAFMCVSRGLASQIFSATREEVRRVEALPPKHPVFYQDPFIGQAIYRLVLPNYERLSPIDVYDLDPFSFDSDGFRIPTGTLIWHNRHKVACRVRCIGEYQRPTQCSPLSVHSALNATDSCALCVPQASTTSRASGWTARSATFADGRDSALNGA